MLKYINTYIYFFFHIGFSYSKITQNIYIIFVTNKIKLLPFTFIKNFDQFFNFFCLIRLNKNYFFLIFNLFVFFFNIALGCFI